MSECLMAGAPITTPSFPRSATRLRAEGGHSSCRVPYWERSGADREDRALAPFRGGLGLDLVDDFRDARLHLA